MKTTVYCFLFIILMSISGIRANDLSSLPKGMVIGKMADSKHRLKAGALVVGQGFNGYVKVYILRDQENLDKGGLWSKYYIGLKGGLHGDYRLLNAEGKEVPRKSGAQLGVSPQLKPERFAKELNRKERKPLVFFGEMPYTSIQSLHIPSLFRISNAGNYTLSIRPYIWMLEKRGLPDQYIIPKQMDPVELDIEVPASWIDK